MKIAFRADASLQIGTGHVMRCLTLAEALKERGCESLFICRQHPGNIIETIRQRGFSVAELPYRGEEGQRGLGLEDSLPPHSGWLGCGWETDARQCSGILSGFKPDWLVVDHYALDFRWEKAARGYARRLLVIDDLADRVHSCDLLLDQNLGRKEEDYQDLVPGHSSLMIGPRYALLRPEFARLRDYSLKRRENPKLRKLLITMGGVDKDNVTGMVLEALKDCPLPEDCQIEVVMGATAPWIDQVGRLAWQMPWRTAVKVGVSNMAELMADSDLAIGAAGATTWERCCLGLPAFLLVLAENQQEIAYQLEHAGAAKVIPKSQLISEHLTHFLTSVRSNSDSLAKMSRASARIVDGNGVVRVIKFLEV